jgi:hypothetical protein
VAGDRYRHGDGGAYPARGGAGGPARRAAQPPRPHGSAPRGQGPQAAAGYGQGPGAHGQGSYGSGAYGPGGHGQGGHGPVAQGPVTGEPEYFTEVAGPVGPGGPGAPVGPGGHGYDDAPGHTRVFSVGEPVAASAGPGSGHRHGPSHGPGPGGGYGPGPDAGAGARSYGGQDPYGDADPYNRGTDAYDRGGERYDRGTDAYDRGEGQFAGDGADAYDNVATYRAGQTAAPCAGPRLPWKELVSGIVMRPGRTFWQMRDHSVWGPALTITFLYGLLAVFGFDAARDDVLHTTLTASIPWMLTTGVAVVLCGLTLGWVTNTLARQLGGDGAWAPTIGLAMLITSLTDAPRLFFALFLGGGNGFVQLLGWITWLACGALMTSMVAKSHDLPWHKALGASAIQLLALLMLFKLPLI